MNIYNKMELNYGSETGRYPCPVCVNLSSKPYYHRHHSTKYLYNEMLSRDQESVDCLTCKEVHHVNLKEERLTIFFSTSTVHDVVKEPDIKSSNHFNIETICGGTIDLLRMNFSLLYYNETRPMNVILSGGLNDLYKSTDEIVHELFLFKRNVLQQNKLNTFFVVKMLRPPKYCWLPRNGAQPTPAGHSAQPYDNKLDMVNALNAVIGKMNKHLGYENEASFEYLGMRGFSKKNEKGEEVVEHQHMLLRWREHMQGAARCLHLDDKLRKVAFKKIIGHIANNLVKE